MQRTSNYKIVYCKKIQLVCEDLIREFAISEIEKKIDPLAPIPDQIQIRHILPYDLKNIINSELSSYNIPPIRYCLSYVRSKYSTQGIHVDGDQSEIIKSAINIPLKGCKDSYQIWYKGDYNTVIVRTSNNVYHNIVWQKPFTEDFRLEIMQPYLLRVDKPHSVVANRVEDRWVFTMRFYGNPDFAKLAANV